MPMPMSLPTLMPATSPTSSANPLSHPHNPLQSAQHGTLMQAAEQAGHSVPQASSKPLAAKATVQAAVAQAEASLQAARAYLLASIDAAWQIANQAADQTADPPTSAPADPPHGVPAGALPPACRRDIRLAASHAVHPSAALVARLYTLAGGGAVFASSPLQRCLRNGQVATQHMMVNDATFELTGRLLLGLPTQVSML